MFHKEFWESDKTYDIIHFQWPEEVVGRMCDDPGIVRRLEERIAFFRSRGTHFVYTRHNVRPHYANEVIGRAYDIIESQSDVVVHMGRFSLEEFDRQTSRQPECRHPASHLSVYLPRGHQRRACTLAIPATSTRSIYRHCFRGIPKLRRDTYGVGAFRSWNEKQKLLLAPASTLSHGSTITAEISSSGGPQKPDTTCSCPCSTA